MVNKFNNKVREEAGNRSNAIKFKIFSGFMVERIYPV